MNRVGHAFIKRRMREENAIFGGEVTGHYYFRDFYYADNGFIPALLILELMSTKNMTLRDLLAPLRAKYFISGEINTQGQRHGAGRRAARGARPTRYKDGHTYTLDGFSAEFPDWHFNVRGVEHRAAAAAESRGADAGADGAEAGRSAGGDPPIRSPCTGHSRSSWSSSGA